MTKIAVIYFPGTNCEQETKRACEAAGLKADVIRWNAKELESYAGYILPGGWSYEDRIRAGVIASKDRILDAIREGAEQGKVVLGICNGCQILVESGIIPLLAEQAQMALAPNINPFISGYYCTWVKIKNSSKKETAFNSVMEDDEVLSIPVAHGEGRFTTKDTALVNELIDHDQLLFRYCDAAGKIIDKFPVNPNGSMINIAGICNKQGNVLAMMPHPERATWQRQVPTYHEEGDGPGPGIKIFESIKEYLK
ncbi:MAG TPA: phosphoribosylformylglycinamidine synthase I [Candidatus Nanoarchaeia archaeon]|nr:phosphoribosylformylglycinamidine synthase I [Candidatus Nanoarchaeia archaeon]